MATALENPKAFRSEMAARWILEAIDCEVCPRRLEAIPVGAPVMPVGDGLGGLIADSDAFQLRQWQAEPASLPSRLHKDFGRFVAVFIKHAHYFHLFSTFE